MKSLLVVEGRMFVERKAGGMRYSVYAGRDTPAVLSLHNSWGHIDQCRHSLRYRCGSRHCRNLVLVDRKVQLNEGSRVAQRGMERRKKYLS